MRNRIIPNRIAEHIDTDFLIKVLIVISIVVIILLSFYWELGLEPIEFGSEYAETYGLVSLSIDLNFVLALITAFCFYIGFRLYTSKKLSQVASSQVIDNMAGMKIKFILVIILGVIGILILYFEFSETYIWMYAYPSYVQVSKVSQALKLNGVIALLLLFIWFVILRIYPSKRN